MKQSMLLLAVLSSVCGCYSPVQETDSPWRHSRELQPPAKDARAATPSPQSDFNHLRNQMEPSRRDERKRLERDIQKDFIRHNAGRHSR